MRQPLCLYLATLVLGALLPDAIAQGNLIVNGDFEATPYGSPGVVTGWTVSGTGNIVSTAQGATTATHSAAFSASGNSEGNVLSQSFATVVGRVYSLDFDAGVFGFTDSPFQLHAQVIGDSTLLDDTFSPVEVGTFAAGRVAFDHHHYTFTADSAVTTLQFTDIGTGDGSADLELDTVSVVLHVTQGAATYSLKDLGTLGGTNSAGNAINAFGQVAGTSGITGDQTSHAFLSGPNGGALTDLGTLGGDLSQGVGINDSGQVAGYSNITTDVSDYHAFLSAPNGGALMDLGTSAGDFSVGHGVNASGQVTGYYETGNGPAHGFLSAPNGGALNDVGPADNGTNITPSGVNTSGQVAGVFRDDATPSHAFLTAPSGGALNDLHTLGGTNSVALGVNDSGQVTGWAHDKNNFMHAFVSGPNGTNLIDLGTAPGDSTEGDAVNACGEVVGHFFSPTDAPLIYYSTGGIRNLNSMVSPVTGFEIKSGKGINDQGQITGYGINSLGEQHAFLLTPNLTIEGIADNSVVLFWPGSCAGPKLQKATVLGDNADWADVSEQPMVVDGASHITETVSENNSRGFYRLVFITGNQNQINTSSSVRASGGNEVFSIHPSLSRKRSSAGARRRAH